MAASTRTLLNGLSGAAFCLLIAPASAQQLNIHLEFDQVSPSLALVTQIIRVNATLSPHGEMTARNELSTLGEKHKRRQPDVSHDESELRLGATSENEWKVVDKNKLINVVDLGSFKRAILLTINSSTWTAEVDFELKPGFSDYEYKRKTAASGSRDQ